MIKKPKKHKGVKYWKAKAWKVFSIFIRQRDTTKLGTFCYTCEKWFDFKETEAGHFQDGRFKEFLFDERQVNAQCKKCNHKKPFGLGGNKELYTLHMVRDFGEEAVKKMLENRNKFGQWKSYELEEIYLKYKSKLKDEI